MLFRSVSKDKNPILIICSYNPAAHQTSVTISDYMEEYGKLGGQRDIIIENMNCKSFSEAPLWSDMMTQILSKYQGEKHPGQIILLGQEAWAAYLSQRDSMQIKDANIEGYRAIRNAGHAILPKADADFESEKYRKTCLQFFKLMCATSLGKLCASDHAMNAIDEMSALNRDIKRFFDENGAAYPVWQALEAEAGRYLR